jgi:hypothetical protein
VGVFRERNYVRSTYQHIEFAEYIDLIGCYSNATLVIRNLFKSFIPRREKYTNGPVPTTRRMNSTYYCGSIVALFSGVSNKCKQHAVVLEGGGKPV